MFYTDLYCGHSLYFYISITSVFAQMCMLHTKSAFIDHNPQKIYKKISHDIKNTLNKFI